MKPRKNTGEKAMNKIYIGNCKNGAEILISPASIRQIVEMVNMQYKPRARFRKLAQQLAMFCHFKGIKTLLVCKYDTEGNQTREPIIHAMAA